MLFLMVLAVFGSQIKMAWLQRLCLPLSGVVFHKSRICHTNTSIIWCREKQTNSNPQEFNKSLLDLWKPTSQHQNSQGNCITDEHGLSFGQPRAESYTLPQKSSLEHPEPAFPPLDTAEDKLISALHTLDEPNPWYQHVATTNPYLHIIEFTELAYSYNVRVALQQMHFKRNWGLKATQRPIPCWNSSFCLKPLHSKAESGPLAVQQNTQACNNVACKSPSANTDEQGSHSRCPGSGF